MLTFRNGTLDDIDFIVEIANEGKAILKSQNINQWQKGTYPDKNIFLQDIQNGICYVVCDDKKVVAVCAVTFTDETSYKNLVSGNWKTCKFFSEDEIKYATIHRSAVKAECRGKGVFSFLVENIKTLSKNQTAGNIQNLLNIKSIRVDTHEKNIAMQKALAKSGFEHCCDLILVEGDEKGDLRYGYELIL